MSNSNLNISKNFILVIVGPTSSGKTKLALEIAKNISGEIISADSRQIYKYLDIGTSKPTLAEQNVVPHHLINIVNPNENFSVYEFREKVIEKLKEIKNKNKIPMLVGGTGFYIKAVIDNLSLTMVAPQKGLREKLKQEAEILGKEHLYNRLKIIDKKLAKKFTAADTRRIIRAIEVWTLTAKPISFFHNSAPIKILNLQPLIIGLNSLSREYLYQRINHKVEEMFAGNFVNEVKSLLKMGFNENYNALNGIGYRQIIKYLKNEITLETAKELTKRDTRHYAKRQLTWFKKDKRINWIDIYRKSDKQIYIEAMNLINAYLNVQQVFSKQ